MHISPTSKKYDLNNNISFQSNRIIRKKFIYGIASLLGIGITMNDIFVKNKNSGVNLNTIDNNDQNLITGINEQVTSILETVNKIAENSSNIKSKIEASEKLNQDVENLTTEKNNKLKELENLDFLIENKQKQIQELEMHEYDLELKIKDLKSKKDDIENIDEKLTQLKKEREKIDIEFNLLQHRKDEVNRYVREKEKIEPKNRHDSYNYSLLNQAISDGVVRGIHRAKSSY